MVLTPEEGSNFKWAPQGRTSFSIFTPFFIFLKFENLHHPLTMIYSLPFTRFRLILGN